MTNKSIRDAFQRFWEHIVSLIDNLDKHIANIKNPHKVTAEQVGADPAGSAASALEEAKEYVNQVGKDFIVTISSSADSNGKTVYSADKTFIEIKDAVDSGKNVIAKHLYQTYNLQFFTAASVIFTNTALGYSVYQIAITNANKVTLVINNLERVSNQVHELSDKSTISQYPSAKAVVDYVDSSMSEMDSKIENAGKVKTVNNVEPDEEGNVEVKSVADFYELENRPFDCELNLLETISMHTINGEVIGYINTNIDNYQYLCVEIDDKKFFDVEVSERTGDIDESLWDNGDGYGFYIEFEDRGVRNLIIYTDTNRYGNSPDVKLYEQLTKKTLNPVYLPKADYNEYGVVKLEKGDEWADWEQYAPCITFDGQVYASKYKAANVFDELSFENLETLRDYVGNHGLFTETIVEGISNEIELTLPVHVWNLGFDYRDYSDRYIFETANGETSLLNIKNSKVTKVQKLYVPQNSSSIFTVNIEETGWDEENETPIWSADKRFSEIYEAYQNGMIVQALHNGNIYTMVYITDYQVEFVYRTIDVIVGFDIERMDDEYTDGIYRFEYLTEAMCEFSRDIETGAYYPVELSILFNNPIGAIIFMDTGMDGTNEVSRNFKATETSLEVYFKNKTLEVSAEDGSVTEKVENAGGSDMFIANITVNEETGSISIDKTFDEVVEAHNSGKIIACNAMGMLSTECRGVTGNGEFKGYNFTFISNSVDSSSKIHAISRTVFHLTKDNEIIASDYDRFEFGGTTYDLTTTSKTIVGAINEVNEKIPTDYAKENHTHDWDDLTNKPFGNIDDIVVGIENIEDETGEGHYNLSRKNFSQYVTSEPRIITVVYNGVKYNIDLPNGFTSSTTEIYGDENFVNYPFYIKFYQEYVPDIGELFYPLIITEEPDKILSFYIKKSIVQCLDEQYIPDTIARKEYVDKAVANAGGSSVFTVNITQNEDGSCSADKTFDEIVEAHESGKFVQAKRDVLMFDLTLIDEEGVAFHFISYTNHEIVKMDVFIWNDNSVECSEEYVAIGDVNDLTTEDKTFAGAINEVNKKVANAGGSAVFTVNITENEDESYSADKTFDEVVEAHENGKVVKMLFNGAHMQCVYFGEDVIGAIYIEPAYANGNIDEPMISKLSATLTIENELFFLHETFSLYNSSNLEAELNGTWFDTLKTGDKTIVGAINELHSKHTEGTDSTILISPNGTRFSVTVGDDGVLKTNKITE